MTDHLLRRKDIAAMLGTSPGVDASIYMEDKMDDQGKTEKRLIRAAEFMARLGIKKTKFYDAKKAGIIPPPVHVTKTVIAWSASVVEQTIDDISHGRLSL